jgi:cytidine deaminase
LEAGGASERRERVHHVVVTSGAEPGTPCGICRQVLAEFGGDMDVLCFTPVVGGIRGISFSKANLR